jgi:hypothetical protein
MKHDPNKKDGNDSMAEQPCRSSFCSMLSPVQQLASAAAIRL